MEPKKQLMETKKDNQKIAHFGGVSVVKKTIDYTTIEIVSHPYLSVSVSNSMENLYTLSELRENANQFTLVNCQMRIFTNKGTFSNLLAL